MPQYAVSYIDLGDPVLKTSIVTAEDWKQAALSVEEIEQLFTEELESEEEPEEGVEPEIETEVNIPDTLEEAQAFAVDNEMAINVVEITEVL